MTRVGDASGDARIRRAPVIVVLASLAFFALVVGEAAAPRAPGPPVRSADASTLPVAGARSAVWHCPGAPALAGIDSSVHISNFGARDATAEVVALPDDGQPVRRVITVPAHAVVRVLRRDLTPAPAALVVESFSSDLVVEELLRGDGASAVGPCATQGSGRWYLAGATTERGIEDWLVLLNPFTDDAVVDVTLLTDTGVQHPAALQAVDVPARSRVVLAVHEAALRQPEVAAVVESRAGGRVVVSQLLRFGEASGRRGVARGIGALALADTWWFADGEGRSGTVRTVAIANPGEIDSEVDVQVVPQGDVAIEPRTLAVPARSLVTLRIGGCGGEATPGCLPMPPGVVYSLVVSATLDVPVVVGERVTATGADAGGATADLATRRPADEWRFARGPLAAQQRAYLAVLNPGSEPVRVSVTVVADGAERVLPDASSVAISAGRTVRIPLDVGEAAATALVVEADGPVVAERVVVQPDDVTRAAGVPRR